MLYLGIVGLIVPALLLALSLLGAPPKNVEVTYLNRKVK